MLHELNMDKTDDKEKIQINFEAFKKKKNPLPRPERKPIKTKQQKKDKVIYLQMRSKQIENTFV